MEDGPVHLQLAAKGGGVGQVAVVAQGNGALAVAHHHGLCIGAHPLAAGGVAHMAHRHFATFGQAVHHLRGKHFVYQA